MNGYVVQRKSDKKFFAMEGRARSGHDRSKWFAKEKVKVWASEEKAKEYVREIIATDARYYGNKTAKVSDYKVLCCEVVLPK